MTRENMVPLRITAGQELNNKFGVFKHSDIIGLPYGTKVPSHSGRGFVYILRPTPELWTLSLPHRTQILYLADIAFIVNSLDIRPGSSVIEAGPYARFLDQLLGYTFPLAGTGSGSFSHSVARTIGNTGHLYSFEFHQERAAKARSDIKGRVCPSWDDNGTPGTPQCGARLPLDGSSHLRSSSSSVVFLDLPAPWDAVPHAKIAMKKDRATRICCFSPCMEQVLRTVTALNQCGFTDLTMYETLLRPHDVHHVPKLVSIDTIIEQVKLHEIKKEQRRLEQVAASDRKRNSRKRKRQEDNDIAEEDGPDPDLGTGDQKRRRDVDASSLSTPLTVAQVQVEPNTGPEPTSSLKTRKESRLAALATSTPMSKPMPEVRGHTSYLTFATLLPLADGNFQVGSSMVANVPSVDATSTTLDRLIATIPEENLERALTG
ncbi:SubName: Full=Related to GCD14-translational repressor of GCN4 {ECO:0000313/EMBL:CCA70645.1} [Serendipita indica DSM 11827]|nr:SubName: Full=Related to GCD14-translational repressor of GCN4 {ECO:0000313/EMBL:CCA70645.1} [Serendipita indica DSM 11827]